MDLITLAGFVGDSMMTYVFGSPLIAGIFMLIVFAYGLNRYKASLSSYVVILLPLMFLLIGATAFIGVGSGSAAPLLPPLTIILPLALVSAIVIFAMFKFFRA